WTVELFVEELADLVGHLGIAADYHVLGHSWGGMLALELAARRPPGLRSIVVADAFASSATYTRQVAELVRALPAETRAAIERHAAAATTDSAAYQLASPVSYVRHVCRRRPVPAELLRTLAALDEASTAYRAMPRPRELTMSGTLKDWDISARLGLLEVSVLL